jgi:outer membrane immunogenic protein
MLRIAVAAAMSFALVGTAAASDLPLKVIGGHALPPVYSWTGPYVGINAGYGVGRNHAAFNVPSLPNTETTTEQPAGVLGGVQAGYNQQIGQWVIGGEVDFQFSAQKDSTCQSACNSSFGIPLSLQVEQKLPWFGTVRGRFGLATGSVMSYVTGGYAYGRVNTDITDNLAGGPGSISFRDTRSGWTAGSGVEAAIGPGWTAKVEYLYVDLGELSKSFTIAGSPQSWTADLRNHVFRGGLNYRFGGGAAALPPPGNWGGFYIGGNVGAGLARNTTATNTRSGGPTAFNEQVNQSPSGWLGGVQAGYNWQSGSWVAGVEADIQYSRLTDDQTCAMGCLPLQFTTLKQTQNWFGTVRGRVGYAVGATLFYGTGGYAYGGVKEEFAQQIIGPASTTVSFRHTRGGWTVGGGIERAADFFGLIGPNWLVRAEYLYIDLGSITDTYTLAGLPNSVTSNLQSHVFRTALSYKFGAPVMRAGN